MTELTASEIVAEFYITRGMGKSKKTFVMVEGKTDRALWVEYMADCALFPTRGKNVIIDALKSYGLCGLPGIAAIVDADYWLITQSDKPNIDNLLYDDCCPDMELILLASPALKKVLRHTFSMCETEQIHEFAEKLKKESLCLAAELGYFRLLNHIEDYGLNFKAIHLEGQGFIDKNTLELDREWAARRLAENKRGITSTELLRGIEKLRGKYPPNIQLCRGKDVLGIMTVIMPILFKSEFGEEFKDLPDSMRMMFRGEQELSRELRKTYEYVYFAKTSLFSCIRKWESDNSPYRIIRD